MPHPVWSARDERQYWHLKDGLVERGLPESLAEDIAARAVHQTRARQADAMAAAAPPPGGGPGSRYDRQHADPGPVPVGRTLTQLRQEARRQGLAGRSTMNKAQLESALAR